MVGIEITSERGMYKCTMFGGEWLCSKGELSVVGGELCIFSHAWKNRRVME